MNNVDKTYLNYINDIMINGTEKEDRTGTGTKSVFRRDMRFKLNEGFPILTTKKVNFNNILHELLWFLGNTPKKYDKFSKTNIKYLVDNNCNIWNLDCYRVYKDKNKEPISYIDFVKGIKNNDEFANENGNLGPIYGKQWRDMDNIIYNTDLSKGSRGYIYNGGIDQLQNSINLLKNNPDSRRNIVTAWNPIDLPRMGLPPCHILYQFYSEKLTDKERYKIWFKNNYETGMEYNETNIPNYNDKYYVETPKRKLSIAVYQRSADSFLGVPYNISSYSILLEMVAHVTNMVTDELIWSGGDCHIYNNHIKQCQKQLTRKGFNELPKLKLNKCVKHIEEFNFDDIQLENYGYQTTIKGSMST